MSIILLLILSSLGLALCALAGFIWGVRSGQFDDTCTPSMRILTDEGELMNSTTKVPPREGARPANHL